MTKLNLKTNTPEIIALQFAQGKQVTSGLTGEPEVLYTLEDGRTWYVKPFVASLIDALSRRKGKAIPRWTKGQALGGRGFTYEVKHPTAKPQQPVGALQPVPQPVAEAQAYANRRRLELTFTSEKQTGTALSRYSSTLQEGPLNDPDCLGATHPLQLSFSVATPGRAALSLLDRVMDIEIMIETVTALDDEDLSPELRATFEHDLAAMIAGTREKVDRTAALLAAFEASAVASGKEAQRLEERKRRMECQHERLSKYVLAVLQLSNRSKLVGNTATLAIRKNPPSVVVDPGAALPAEYMRTPAPPAPVPDKAAIKAALKAHVAIPGCHLADSVRLVRT